MAALLQFYCFESNWKIYSVNF